MDKLKAISLSIFFCLILKIDTVAQIPQPEEGKAQIVFYRKKKMSGAAIKFNIQDSERVYGDLKNGDVLTISVNPGEHTFYSKVFREDAITLNVEEGKVYYVKTTIRVGYYAGRPKFDLVDEKTGQKYLK
mgnify:CR=1 FL=1|jgi:hypothetical protein